MENEIIDGLSFHLWGGGGWGGGVGKLLGDFCFSRGDGLEPYPPPPSNQTHCFSTARSRFETVRFTTHFYDTCRV